MQNKSLLIIGGTGFFGKSILDSFKRGLLNKHSISKIIILARNTERFAIDYPELIISGVDFISGDISSISELPNADFVIHAATSTNMSNYIGEEMGGNYLEEGVENYCKLATKFHLGARILYCSSGAVYGKQPLDIEKIDESYPLENDLSTFSIEKKNYCILKRNSENLIINLGKRGIKTSIARCFAFCGKYLPKDQHYAYGNFIGQAEKGETIKVNSSGVVYRSYMHADDLVESLMQVLLVSSLDCPIINIGSDIQISLYDLAKTIAMKYGVNCEFENYNDKVIIDRYVPNTEKLQKILNQKND